MEEWSLEDEMDVLIQSLQSKDPMTDADEYDIALSRLEKIVDVKCKLDRSKNEVTDLETKALEAKTGVLRLRVEERKMKTDILTTAISAATTVGAVILILFAEGQDVIIRSKAFSKVKIP